MMLWSRSLIHFQLIMLIDDAVESIPDSLPVDNAH